MPRYKCKVDVVYPFEFEMSAVDSDELHSYLVTNKSYNLEDAQDRILEIADIEELPEIAALFTYPPLPDTASDRMKEAYKIMVEEIQLATQQPIIDDLLNKEYSDDPTSLIDDFMNHQSKEKIRKQSDTTKINQEQFDIIYNQYGSYKLGKLPNINTTQKFTNYLNDILGLNKSRSVYSKIWNGGVDRESLPKGG